MDNLSARILIFIGCILIAVSTAGAAPAIGETAPDFVLRSQDGKNLRLSEYRTQVVVLNFWASWCGECRKAASLMEDLQQKFADDVQILAVNIDHDLQQAAEFVSQTGVRFPVLSDTEKNLVSKEYGLNRLPYSIVIDREGIARYLHTGFDSDSSSIITAELIELIAE